VQEQATKPYGALPLEERWICEDPAPGDNWIHIACFDSELGLVRESFLYAAILDGANYVFDFETETLETVSLPAVAMMSLGIVAGLAFLGTALALATKRS